MNTDTVRRTKSPVDNEMSGNSRKRAHEDVASGDHDDNDQPPSSRSKLETNDKPSANPSRNNHPLLKDCKRNSIEERNRCKMWMSEVKSNYKKSGCTQTFLDSLKELNKSCLDNVDRSDIAPKSFRIAITSDLRADEVDDILFAITMKCLPKTRLGSDITDLEMNILEAAITSLQFFTSNYSLLSVKLCETTSLLEKIAEALLDHGVLRNTWRSKETFLSSLLRVIYNCSLHPENRKRLRGVGFAWILERVVNCEVTEAAFVSSVALVGILDEEEIKIFQSQIRVSTYLSCFLKSAIESSLKCYKGWTSKELIRACKRLAMNDDNKKTLVDFGILKLLLKLCQDKEHQDEPGHQDEIKEVLRVMWTLAFDAGNKKKMVDNEELILELIRLTESQNEKVKVESNNTLWILRATLRSSTNPEFQKRGEELCTIPARTTSSTNTTESRKHVMISYNWGSQEIVLKVNDYLEKSGYRLWLDRNEIKGSIADCVANAVENADVVLMCLSHGYKHSEWCRAEAEYAFQNKTRTIPLLMESGYKADGWLGLFKGTKKHFDFSDPVNFEMTIQALIEEIGQAGRSVMNKRSSVGMNTQTVAQGPYGHGAVTAAQPKPSFREWTSEDVEKWLRDNNCFGYMEYLKEMVGVGLLVLKDLNLQDPESFYNHILPKLELKDVICLAKFCQTLKRL